MGMWLSEPALWMFWEHCGDFVAVRDAEILALSAKHFAETVHEFQTLFYTIVMYARAFLRFLLTVQKSDILDAPHDWTFSIRELYGMYSSEFDENGSDDDNPKSPIDCGGTTRPSSFTEMSEI